MLDFLAFLYYNYNMMNREIFRIAVGVILALVIGLMMLGLLSVIIPLLFKAAMVVALAFIGFKIYELVR